MGFFVENPSQNGDHDDLLYSSYYSRTLGQFEGSGSHRGSRPTSGVNGRKEVHRGGTRGHNSSQYLGTDRGWFRRRSTDGRYGPNNDRITCETIYRKDQGFNLMVCLWEGDTRPVGGYLGT